MDLFAIRNRTTGRLLVLANESTLGYELWEDDPSVQKAVGLVDSEEGGAVYVTSDRAQAERLLADGEAADDRLGALSLGRDGIDPELVRLRGGVQPAGRCAVCGMEEPAARLVVHDFDRHPALGLSGRRKVCGCCDRATHGVLAGPEHTRERRAP